MIKITQKLMRPGKPLKTIRTSGGGSTLVRKEKIKISYGPERMTHRLVDTLKGFRIKTQTSREED